MQKKSINVKKHPRKLQSGKVVNVKKHNREIDLNILDERVKDKIVSGKSKSLNLTFVETIDENPKLKLNRVLNNIELNYVLTSLDIQIAKKIVADFRKVHQKSYYFIGSINKQKVYRVYFSVPYPEPLTKKEVKEPENADELIKLQIKEKDWSHLSNNYPNLIGFSDEHIENFIKDYISKVSHYKSENESIRKELEEYISKIQCYNKEDFRELSVKMYDEYNNLGIMNKQSGHKSKTVFVTSPRGGFEVLSAFAYANGLDKSNMPFDFYNRSATGSDSTTKMYMASESMPYGSSVRDIDDIIYIDDICMSGEQQDKAYSRLEHIIKKLKISPEEKPRLHYMAFVGSADVTYIEKSSGRRKVRPLRPWESVILGEKRDFSHKKVFDNTTKKSERIYNDASAAMFPYGVPDGERHHRALMLYKYKKD